MEVPLFAIVSSGTRDALQRGMIRISMLLWALASLVPAQATTLRRASLDDLIQLSSSIVRGQVTGTYTAPNKTHIDTHYTVQVLDRWKGSNASQVDVMVPCCDIAGAPRFSVGSVYVFFLWTGPSGTNHILGLSQGVLNVGADETGAAIVVRQPSEALVLNAAGAEGSQDPMEMKLSDFASRVVSAVRSGAAAK
jgi:hypothetical protein